MQTDLSPLAVGKASSQVGLPAKRLERTRKGSVILPVPLVVRALPVVAIGGLVSTIFRSRAKDHDGCADSKCIVERDCLLPRKTNAAVRCGVAGKVSGMHTD